jgi:putative ABC transport system permease protein
MDQRGAELVNEEVSISEDTFKLVDKNFFSVFDVEWLRGDQARAFVSPNAVVLTEDLARQFFGNDDPFGLTLVMDGEHLLTVSGVIADLPTDTHLTGRAFASFDLLEMLVDDPTGYLGSWQSARFYTYVVLEEGAGIGELEAQFAALFAQQYSDDSPFIPGATTTLQSIPLTDIHMKSHTLEELRPGGSVVVVSAFSAIGIGILVIACINFVNITTAWASRRAREVGVRKVLGATSKQLVWQFTGETLLLCSLAMILALAAVELLLPMLNGLLAIDLQAGMGSTGTVSLILLLMTITLGLAAGWYPSLYLSSFRASAVLRGEPPAGQSGLALRGVLVLLQFAIVVVLLIATAVIQLQLRHAANMDLGFQREQIIVINAARVDLQDQYGALRDTLLQSPNVISVSSSGSSPLLDLDWGMTTFQGEGDSVPRNISTLSVDYDYFATFGIEVLAGRIFSRDFPADAVTGAVVINESAARELGREPANATGLSIQSNGDSLSVVGVVADTVDHAKVQAKPLVYSIPDLPMAGELIAIRVREGKAAEALTHVDNSWKLFSPDSPIRRTFLDDKIDALYLQDSRQLQLSFLFSVLAIVIACMGLYGLAAFSTESRTKEIGIRKVMGGSVWSIVVLLTNELSKLVLFSNLIAWPVAYYVMGRWLENFAYRIDLTPLVFIGSGLIALCVAWVTVGGTAAKAASAKPVLALRYE